MRLKMVLVQIVGLKHKPGVETPLRATVRALRRLGCVQIEELSVEIAGIVSARPLRPDRGTVRDQEELAYLVAKMEGLMAVLGIEQGEPGAVVSSAAPGADCAAEARASLDSLGSEVQVLTSRREALEAE